MFTKAQWGFSTKLAVLVGVSVLVTGSIIFLWTYQSFHAALVTQTLDEVGNEALVASVRLTASIDRVSEDVRFLSDMPPVQEIIRATESKDRRSRDGEISKAQLAGLFVEMLKAKPLYLQIRFIGVADHGLELVKVERVGGTILVVPPSQLESKEHRDYFQETITQQESTAPYISPITLTRQHNQIQSPYLPVMRVGLPVFSEFTGELFGLIVVNVNMGLIFLERTSSLPSFQTLYIVNEDGEFLVHPNPEKTFRFEFGQSHQLADQFPEVAGQFGNLNTQSPPLVWESREGSQVLGIHKAYLDPPNQQRFLGVMVEDSYEHALAQVVALRNQTIAVGLGLLILAFLAAQFFSRKMTRPLFEIAQAAINVGKGIAGIRIPVQGKDEIGQLAQSFNTMVEQIEDRTKLADLESEMAVAISQADRMGVMLQDCTNALGLHLKVAYTGIWLVNEVNQSLEFQARAGWDSQLEGVPQVKALGHEEAERIATERTSYWTNTIIGDPGIVNQHWAKQDNLVAFAGYPLMLGERVLGVVVLFARQSFSAVTLHGLERVMDRLTLGIDRFRQEELFKTIVESSPNGLLMVNPDGKITVSNHRMETLFGYSRTELLGQPVEMLVPNRFRDIHPGERTTFFGNPKPRAMGAGRDLYGRRKDGSECAIEIGLNPVRTDQGLFVLASVVDITERKQAEERFRLVFEASPSAILLVDADGIMTLVNKQTEELFGYTRDEMVGHLVEMLVPQRFRTLHSEQREGFFRMPSTRQMGKGRDLFGLRKDGSEFPTEIGLNPVTMDQGTFVLVSIVDITERVQAGKRLLDSLQEKEVLLKEVHHRVKNNLAVIGSLFYLQSTTTQSQEVRRILQDCQDRVRSMALVHERLYGSDDLASVNFAEYAEELAMHLFRNYSLDPDAIQLKLDLENISLDIDQAIPCGLILTELISNALKHAFPKGRSGVIQITLKRIAENRIVLRVVDDGVGLPDEPTLTTSRSLGMRLVNSLATQLDAVLQFLHGNPGTKAQLEVEVSNGSKL
ncbi:PAS domain S-box protein [Candidatus Nitronereus thalassa]|uniref:PAS domain S-box protein n=1 Tax=Candidatus Nitronereus thalassa TaxID=3020898 RepID=A0ABU3K3R7_9BACT|nr:PAS domain S-box protein [Candidatus Nitronereus thalassa]MDT7041028.1 PAS domain S-box protein [Candidatus Nitronereus thalassa]